MPVHPDTGRRVLAAGLVVASACVLIPTGILSVIVGFSGLKGMSAFPADQASLDHQRSQVRLEYAMLGGFWLLGGGLMVGGFKCWPKSRTDQGTFD